jgi:hypothetical protein
MLPPCPIIHLKSLIPAFFLVNSSSEVELSANRLSLFDHSESLPFVEPKTFPSYFPIAKSMSRAIRKILETKEIGQPLRKNSLYDPVGNCEVYRIIIHDKT